MLCHITNIIRTAVVWFRGRQTKSILLHAIQKLDWILNPENKNCAIVRNRMGSDIRSPERDDNGGGRTMTGYIYLPFSPIPLFGRRETLDRVYSYFTSTPISSITSTFLQPRVSVLWGMPGVGKTQIAVTLAYMLKRLIPNIFWISSDQNHNLADGFMKIARLVDSIPDKCLVDQNMAISEVKKWLQSSSQDWLLVFDNVSDSGSLEKFWPLGERGRILVTTRNVGLLCPYTTYLEPIIPFSDNEGVDCLLGFLPDDLRQDAKRSPEIISELVSELGALPLALFQAASFICQTRCPISKYLSLFKDSTHCAALLDLGEHMNNACKTSVGATFKLAYESVGSLNRKSRELLDMLSWFNPDKIPEDILNPSFGLFEGNPVMFETTMAVLLRFGLLVRSKGSSSIHRLIQTTVTHQMDLETRLESFQRGIRYIKASFSTVPSCDSLFPIDCPPLDEVRHVLSQILTICQKHQEYRIELYDPGFADLCSWTGCYFMDISNMEGARQMFQKSHDIYEKFDECKHQRAIILGGLGWLVMREGKLDEALGVTNEAVELMEAAVGPSHPHNSWVLSNRGRIHLFSGEIQQSLEDARRSFDIMKQVDQVHQHTEQSTAALSVYRNFYAISLYTHISGGVSGDLYEPSLENTKNTFTEMMEPEEMEAMKEPIELCRENIQVLLNKSGLTISLAWVELSLSWMLLYIGDLEDAERTTLESLKHIQQDYPPEGCGVGVAKIQLADCYFRRGNTMQAFCEYSEALENLESSVGRQNPLYVIGSHKMANFLCQCGRYEEACKLYEFCLVRLRKLYGESNPATKMTENNLGIALININEKVRGLQFLCGSLVYREHCYGNLHKLTRRAKMNYEAACTPDN
jgi:tetratricopeptide (TPR) repeat protein